MSKRGSASGSPAVSGSKPSSTGRESIPADLCQWLVRPSPEQEFILKPDGLQDSSMRWLGLVLCLLWLGWRLQSLWQGVQRWRRRDALSHAFQVELQRRRLVSVGP